MTDNFNEEEYISGFNKGYYLAKEFPELADILRNATGTSDRLEGMKDGREQYSYDHFESRLPSFLKDSPFDKQDKTVEKNKGKDIEPDIER